MSPHDLTLAHAPYRLTGTVVAALLNHGDDWRGLGKAAFQAPYKAPAQRPVLGVRPPNTWSVSGSDVCLDGADDEWVVGASLGIVIGRPACRVAAAEAGAVVAGYLVANDGSLPVASHYRPALRQRCGDGLCVLGQELVPAAGIPRPDELSVSIEIDGRVVQQSSTGGRVRSVAQLVAAVSAFMTLSPGDLLLLGPAPQAPRARPGQSVRVSIDGIGEVNNRVTLAGVK